MGDVNQILYLQRVMPAVSGPVLEVGSKDYGNTSSFRDVFPGQEYIGVDMEPGKNVDRVVDLTKGTDGLQQHYYAFGICCSVLEHVPKPWVFAQNLSNVMRPGGHLYMSVPWVWRYHAYPDDYFRFSWRGVMELFPEFTWTNIRYSTNVPDEFVDVGPDNPTVDNMISTTADTPAGQRKYLPYLMINMLGQKTA